MSRAQVLLLAGTAEAAEIAACLAAMPGVDAVASLAGATRAPRELGLPTRRGGFGGGDAFAAYLQDRGIGIVVDATHPFAARMTQRTAAICRAQGVKYLLVQRPPWRPEPGDTWVPVADAAAAAARIPAGATVFLATGRQTLAQFSGLRDCRVLCRVIDPPTVEFPFENGRFVVGRPPFSVQDERDFLRSEGVDWIVAKNAGGTRSRAKLIAARQLGLPVAMLDRPAPPACDMVASAAEACAWLKQEAR